MKDETFRGFLDRLRGERELTDIRQPVDIRHIATLVDQSEQALLFHNVIGYAMPVVSGILRTQKRAALGMGVSSYAAIQARLQQGITQPLAPRYVETALHKQVIQLGDDVDLFKLPVPMSSIYDGGPMITAGGVLLPEPQLGVYHEPFPLIVVGKKKNRDIPRHPPPRKPLVSTPFS